MDRPTNDNQPNYIAYFILTANLDIRQWPALLVATFARRIQAKNKDFKHDRVKDGHIDPI